MGRPKLGKEYKKPSDYTYDYPENRRYEKMLIKGDVKRIALTLSLTDNYIRQMLRGERKMRHDVIELIERHGEINKLKLEI